MKKNGQAWRNGDAPRRRNRRRKREEMGKVKTCLEGKTEKVDFCVLLCHINHDTCVRIPVSWL